MRKCGLLGKKLGHSYSPQIHSMLGEYEYGLYEKTEEELEDFVKSGVWDGLNVTIPYKKSVLPFCDKCSDVAAKIGSVNTMVRQADGTIFGDNTDVYGFLSLVRKSGIDVKGRKTLVLGSGGAAQAVLEGLSGLGAEAVVISRSGENHYGNLAIHSDAEVIVNTTPVGMYPDNLKSPLDLSVFPDLKGVIDVIYNPDKTGILLQAEERGIPHINGLYMLVAQAKKSSERFTGTEIAEDRIGEITERLAGEMKNIVLIGMPGSGKTSVAESLAKKLGREIIDSDRFIVRRAGMSIPEIFEKEGEEGFRKLETEVLSEIGKKSSVILSTGGGCVTRKENYPLLHQNGVIFEIKRDTERLTREGRPLSQGDLTEMYKKRAPMYKAFRDYEIDNNGTIEEAAEKVAEVMK